MSSYFSIEMNSNDTNVATRDTIVPEQFACPACGFRKELTHLTDIENAYDPANLPLSFLQQPFLPVLRRDLFMAIGEETIRRYCWGSKLYEAGTDPSSSEFFIVAPKRGWVNLRGNKKSSYRACEECGNYAYFGCGMKTYVVRHAIRDNLELYIDQRCHILLRDDVTERVLSVRAKWPKLKIKELEILDEPRDGFPVDLQPKQR